MVRLKTDRDKEEDDFYWSEPTKQQLQELHIDVQKAGGRENFLVSIGVKKLGGMYTYNGNEARYSNACVYDESKKGCSVREGWSICYRNGSLVQTWKDIFDRLDKYEYGLEMYKKNNPQII